jgi:hypothetical protein
VSTRFTSALSTFDSKYKATEKARVVDDKYAVTRSATHAWNSLNSYFDQALNNPTGHKLRHFYAEGNKQVVDVHNEARHLADLKSGRPSTAAGASVAAEPSAAAAVVPGMGEKQTTAEVETSTGLSEKPSGS